MPTYQQDIEHSMQLMRRALEENAEFAEMEERIKHSLVQIHHDHDQ